MRDDHPDARPAERHADLQNLLFVAKAGFAVISGIAIIVGAAAIVAAFASYNKLNEVATQTKATAEAVTSVKTELERTNEKVQQMWFEGGWSYKPHPSGSAKP